MTKPPPLSPSQWADKYRRLSPEASAVPGAWQSHPYQVGLMDAVVDHEKVVIMAAAQSSKTEILLNLLGYWVTQSPGPTLVIQPTLEMGGVWSRDRLGPMVRDCPILTERFAVSRGRNAKASVRSKSFDGGQLAIVGANSPAGLASRPIRYVLIDEVDRFPHSAKSEGDPVSLAEARATTFPNRRIVMVSTPTTEGFSRIFSEYKRSDQRRWEIRCPQCGLESPIEWESMRWEGGGPEEPTGDPSAVWWECPRCGGVLPESEARPVLEAGRWVASNPESKIAGFYLPGLISPWLTWSEIATEYVAGANDPAREQPFWNLRLGLPYADGDSLDQNQLQERAEDYPAVPPEVMAITCGVDIQGDRIEALTVGWGEGEESWVLEHRIFFGNPKEKGDPSWAELDDFIKERRGPHSLVATCVDSGHWVDSVYAFCLPRYAHRVYATKGRGGMGEPIVIMRRKRKGAPARCPVFTVGTDGAKEAVFARLAMREGHGRIHFRRQFDDEFFAQVVSERRVVEHRMGRATIRWVKTRDRNEALDMLVLNLAALRIARPSLMKVVSQADEGDDPPPKRPSYFGRKRF